VQTALLPFYLLGLFIITGKQLETYDGIISHFQTRRNSAEKERLLDRKSYGRGENGLLKAAKIPIAVKYKEAQEP